MYGGIGNSLLAGCIAKWPWLIPVAMLGAGGLVYESCFDGGPSIPITPPPAVITPVTVPVVPVEIPKVVVPLKIDPPKVVAPPTPLPPKKKPKG